MHKVLFHQGPVIVPSRSRHGPKSQLCIRLVFVPTFTVTHRHAPVTVLNFPILGQSHAPLIAGGEFCYMDVHFVNGLVQVS